MNAIVSPIVSKVLKALRDRALGNADLRQALDALEARADVDDEAVLGWVESRVGTGSVLWAHRSSSVPSSLERCPPPSERRHSRDRTGRSLASSLGLRGLSEGGRRSPVTPPRPTQVESSISLLSTAAGVYVAHRLDDVVYLYGACLAGATAAADHSVALLETACPKLAEAANSRQVKQAVVVALAVSGFSYQKVLGRGHLPFFVRLPLVPLTLAESALASLAFSFRAARVAP